MSSVLLVEWDIRDPDTNQIDTQYYATEPGYRTGDGDVPENKFYEPRVSNPGTVGRYIFGDGRTGGGSSAPTGSIKLKNADGGLDRFVYEDWGMDGADVRIYIGDTTMARSAFTLITTLVSEQGEGQIEVSGRDSSLSFDILIKDPMALFDKPFQTSKFAGTNVGPVGFEGTAADLKGTVKPAGYGDYFNASAKLANASLLIFQYSDRQTQAVAAVYDNGVALSNSGDVATEASLISQSVSSGAFITCLSMSLLKLGADPAGLITVDVSSGGSAVASGDAAKFNNQETATFNGKVSPVNAQRVLGSFWINPSSYAVNDGTYAMPIMGSDPDRFFVFLGADSMSVTAKRKRLIFRLGGSTDNLLTASTIPLSTWTHVAYAFDIPSQVFQVAVNGSLQTFVSASGMASLPSASRTLGMNGTSTRAFSIGGNYVPSSTENKLRGCLAEVYVAPNQWGDLSDPVVVRNFRTVSGYPAELGNNGQAPTGVIPAIYVKGYGSQFATNLGAAASGGFTATSLPTQCADSPYAPASAASFIAATAGNILQQIAQQRAGLTSIDIATADFTALDLACPQTLGVYVDGERQIRDVMDDIANSVGAFYTFTRDRKLSAGKLSLPGGTPTFYFENTTKRRILRLKSLRTTDEGKGTPAYSVIVKYYKNYTEQTTGVAGSVTAERRAFLAQEWRQINVPDNTVKQRHPESPELTFESLISDEVEAQAFHDDRLNIYSHKRMRFLIEVFMDPDVAQIELGDVVRVTYNRFGLDDGRDFIVIGINMRLDRNIVEFDLWGGVKNAISGSAAGSATVSGDLADYLPSLMSGWWRADSVTFSSGVSVQRLSDLTGGGGHFDQATVSKQPTWTASDPLINNKPYISFDGVNDEMEGLTSSSLLVSGNAAAIYIVARWDDIPTEGGDSDGTVITFGDLIRVCARAGSPPEAVFDRYAGPPTSDYDSALSDIALDSWYMIEAITDGVTVDLTVAGMPPVSVPATAALGGTLSSPPNLGTSFPSIQVFSDIDLAEVIAIKSTLSSGDRAAVRAYLADRYGISWDLPRRNRTIQGGANRTVQGGAIREVLDQS